MHPPSEGSLHKGSARTFFLIKMGPSGFMAYSMGKNAKSFKMDQPWYVASKQ